MGSSVVFSIKQEVNTSKSTRLYTTYVLYTEQSQRNKQQQSQWRERQMAKKNNIELYKYSELAPEALMALATTRCFLLLCFLMLSEWNLLQTSQHSFRWIFYTIGLNYLTLENLKP